MAQIVLKITTDSVKASSAAEAVWYGDRSEPNVRIKHMKERHFIDLDSLASISRIKPMVSDRSTPIKPDSCVKCAAMEPEFLSNMLSKLISDSLEVFFYMGEAI